VPGVELDRPRLRALRRELRRTESLAAAASVLRRRDVSIRALDERLERRGIAAAERKDVVDRLVRARILDDERFAFARAATLAARGRGDEAIRWQLERERVPAATIDAALTALEPEAERARRVAAARRGRVKIARLLASRGFSEAAIETALGGELGGDDRAELG
jgi:regulatory protein